MNIAVKKTVRNSTEFPTRASSEKMWQLGLKFCTKIGGGKIFVAFGGSLNSKKNIEF
jgi:hypothetical protein